MLLEATDELILLIVNAAKEVGTTGAESPERDAHRAAIEAGKTSYDPAFPFTAKLEKIFDDNFVELDQSIIRPVDLTVLVNFEW